jgi:hypothetical protein
MEMTLNKPKVKKEKSLINSVTYAKDLTTGLSLISKKVRMEYQKKQGKIATLPRSNLENRTVFQNRV